MNTTDNPQQRHDMNAPDPARSVPNEPRERPEPVEATTVPEAVRAAQVAREDKQHAIVRGQVVVLLGVVGGVHGVVSSRSSAVSVVSVRCATANQRPTVEGCTPSSRAIRLFDQPASRSSHPRARRPATAAPPSSRMLWSGSPDGRAGRAVMREFEARRWAAMTAVAGTVFIAAGAFWLSFTSLADLAARSGIGAGQAWAWPLIVDGIIVVATVAVVALAGQRSAWYPWALLVGGALVSVTANAIHAVVAADTDVPRILAASVAAVPPVVLLAITHLTVILTRTPETNTKAPAVASFTTSAGEALPALPPRWVGCRRGCTIDPHSQPRCANGCRMQAGRPGRRSAPSW